MIEQRAQPDRRAPKFTEKLSLILVWIAGLGGFIIILEPQFTGAIWGNTFKIGTAVSAEMKGAVIQLMLIGGFIAVTKFWLDVTAAGAKQSESMSRIAEASAPVAAAAVAAAAVAPTSPIKAEEVKVEGDNVTVTKGGQK